MKYLYSSLLLICLLVSSCLTNKQSITNYSDQMQAVKVNFPELYELYLRGAIIIYDVYTYEEDGKPRVGISYKYRY